VCASDDRPHVLVVEDDPSLADWICNYLLENDFSISIANRGDEALELIRLDNPDVVLLDVNIPSKNGFEVCEAAREFYSNPILMLTAREAENDEVMGIKVGATDYLIKPVRPKALLARINALLRKDEEQSDIIKVYGSLTINAESRYVALEGEEVDLTSHEFDLLWLIAKHAGTVFTRDEIIKALRGIEYDPINRSVDILISRLRKKLKDDTRKPAKIKTIWGKGYMLAPDAW